MKKRDRRQTPTNTSLVAGWDEAVPESTEVKPDTASAFYLNGEGTSKVKTGDTARIISYDDLKRKEEKQKRLEREIKEAEDTLHNSFKILKEEIWKHIDKLEEERPNGKTLSGKEELVIENLKKNLDNFEKIVAKEIEDIKREVGK